MGQIPKSIALGETHTRQQKDKVETHIHLRVFFISHLSPCPKALNLKHFFLLDTREEELKCFSSYVQNSLSWKHFVCFLRVEYTVLLFSILYAPLLYVNNPISTTSNGRTVLP